MLGVRHYSGRAIDLWFGDHRKFACDLLSKDLNEGLNASEGAKARHLVFLPDSKVRNVMNEIKEYLDSHPDTAWPKRITVVLDEPNQYKKLQQELFSSFPTQ